MKHRPLLVREVIFNVCPFDLGSSVDDVGIVKNLSFVSIFLLIPLLNSFTCLRMYRRNASLDHLPSSITVYTGTPDKFIAMAAPLLAECNPIWSGVKPSSSGPMEAAAILSREKSSGPENKWVLLSLDIKVFTIVVGPDVG